MQVNADIRTALINFRQAHRAGKRAGPGGSADPVHAIRHAADPALRNYRPSSGRKYWRNSKARQARLPVLLTLPMIIFILPCVFLVVAGPAMVDVYRSMR